MRIITGQILYIIIVIAIDIKTSTLLSAITIAQRSSNYCILKSLSLKILILTQKLGGHLPPLLPSGSAAGLNHYFLAMLCLKLCHILLTFYFITEFIIFMWDVLITSHKNKNKTSCFCNDLVRLNRVINHVFSVSL